MGCASSQGSKEHEHVQIPQPDTATSQDTPHGSQIDSYDLMRMQGLKADLDEEPDPVKDPPRPTQDILGRIRLPRRFSEKFVSKPKSSSEGSHTDAETRGMSMEQVWDKLERPPNPRASSRHAQPQAISQQSPPPAKSSGARKAGMSRSLINSPAKSQRNIAQRVAPSKTANLPKEDGHLAGSSATPVGPQDTDLPLTASPQQVKPSSVNGTLPTTVFRRQPSQNVRPVPSMGVEEAFGINNCSVAPQTRTNAQRAVPMQPDVSHCITDVKVSNGYVVQDEQGFRIIPHNAPSPVMPDPGQERVELGKWQRMPRSDSPVRGTIQGIHGAEPSEKPCKWEQYQHNRSVCDSGHTKSQGSSSAGSTPRLLMDSCRWTGFTRSDRAWQPCQAAAKTT